MPRWGKPQPVSEHIRQRVSIEDRGYATPCWVWQSGINNAGYPTGRPAGYRHGGMHRAAYETWIGPIPDKHVIDHLCRVRCCVNPDHLEAVTQAENLRRAGLNESGGSGNWKRIAARRNSQAGGDSRDERRSSLKNDVRTHRNGSVTR